MVARPAQKTEQEVEGAQLQGRARRRRPRGVADPWSVGVGRAAVRGDKRGLSVGTGLTFVRAQAVRRCGG
jgi:hypothetical protein